MTRSHGEGAAPWPAGAGQNDAVIGSRPVLRVADIDAESLAHLCARYALQLECVPRMTPIPSSYWGDPEAGLARATLYVRNDTPVHSALHETAHFVCMDSVRRACLDRDAGGEYAEEDAVCYLQIVLADYLPGSGRRRMCCDMDAWGYTFRLGSARAWFEQDAADACEWLCTAGVLDTTGAPTWRRRGEFAPAPAPSIGTALAG